MSNHERKRLKNRQRRLNEAGNITLHAYKADWNNPELVEAVNKFFEFKHVNQSTNYNLTARQYIQAYQVSNVYALRCNGEFIAVKLSCEQCPVVGGDNTSYSRNYAKYYPGIIMQYILLSELVKKRKTGLCIGGAFYEGQRIYKQHFNSIEEIAYYGVIYRSFTQRLKHKFKAFMKAVLPAKIITIIRAVKNRWN